MIFLLVFSALGCNDDSKNNSFSSDYKPGKIYWNYSDELAHLVPDTIICNSNSTFITYIPYDSNIKAYYLINTWEPEEEEWVLFLNENRVDTIRMKHYDVQISNIDKDIHSYSTSFSYNNEILCDPCKDTVLTINIINK